MTTELGAPIAVPGFERLVWREPAVLIRVRPRHNHMAQIVRLAEAAGDEALAARFRAP